MAALFRLSTDTPAPAEGVKVIKAAELAPLYEAADLLAAATNTLTHIVLKQKKTAKLPAHRHASRQ